jgi:hypothetical protein
MDVAGFVERLGRLTGTEISALADALRHEHDTVDGEVSWWRATVTVGADLKRHHRSREAGLAAHHASAAVVHAAEAAGETITRDDATIVARAAADVARVLVADHDHDVPPATMAVLLAPWRLVVPTAA